MDLQAFKDFNERVLDVIDELEIHREAVSVPLGFEGDGDVRLETPVRLVIIGPEGNPDAFLDSLPERLATLDLSALPRI